MAQSRNQTTKASRIERPLIIGALSIAFTALIVELSRTGVDILLLVIVGFAVILIERTVGDWLGELLGSARSAIVLTVCLGAVIWSLFDSGGLADRFLVFASKAGYDAAYLGPEAARRTKVSPAPAVTTASVVGSSGGSSAQPPADASNRPVATTVAPPGSVAPPERRDKGAGAVSPAPSFKQVTIRFVDVPSVAMISEGLTVRARFLADGEAFPRQSVEFLVNERSYRRVLTAEDGTATTVFLTRDRETTPSVPGSPMGHSAEPLRPSP